MKRPLDGIRVLDLSRVLAGPYCTMLLADMGAEVIKIERPETGDDSRFFSPFKDGESGYYIFLNRGKKSITLNLREPEAVAVFKDLVKISDVVVENFKPGVVEKLGIGYSELKRVNPRIVYASISGFGQDGPFAHRPAYDIVAQAMGGLMSITGYPEVPPTRAGNSLGDVTSGLFTAYGILLALFHRERSGDGQYVDVAMMDSIFSFLENNVMRYLFSGVVPTRIGSRHPISAPFDIYQAKDGYVVIAVANDALFKRFAEAIGKPELALDERFVTDPQRLAHQQELKEIIEEWTREQAVEEVVEYLNGFSIPSSPVLDIAQVCAHPQIQARRMLVEIEQPGLGPIKVPATPVKLSETPAVVTGPAPALGEHNQEVLETLLRYSAVRIEHLKAKGAI